MLTFDKPEPPRQTTACLLGRWGKNAWCHTASNKFSTCTKRNYENTCIQL